jgi:Flp pilus assembly protein CpaB
MTLEVTEKEMEIVRAALCQYSLKQLGIALNAQCESKKSNTQDISCVWFDNTNSANAIIARIDDIR